MPRCPWASSWHAPSATTTAPPGIRVGLKAAGGLKTARDALSWLVLVKEELGGAWMSPHLFRIGASSLLADIERQLEHHVTGRYSAFHRHPLG